MIVNPHMDVHTKTPNHRKTLRKSQKRTTFWKSKE